MLETKLVELGIQFYFFINNMFCGLVLTYFLLKLTKTVKLFEKSKVSIFNRFLKNVEMKISSTIPMCLLLSRLSHSFSLQGERKILLLLPMFE